MSRAFSQEAIAPSLFEECVDLAARAPSAGKPQGWSLLVLTEDETSQYWNIALPTEKRKGFAFPSLLNAPLVALVLADPHAYLARYSEADKASTGLGESVDQWPAPYWTIDASFATMTLLLALEDRGVSSLFFAPCTRRNIAGVFWNPNACSDTGNNCMWIRNVRPRAQGEKRVACPPRCLFYYPPLVLVTIRC